MRGREIDSTSEDSKSDGDPIIPRINSTMHESTQVQTTSRDHDLDTTDRWPSSWKSERFSTNLLGIIISESPVPFDDWRVPTLRNQRDPNFEKQFAIPRSLSILSVTDVILDQSG
jgi:hypothetical protein